jgi:hypothetical protein
VPSAAHPPYQASTDDLGRAHIPDERASWCEGDALASDLAQLRQRVLGERGAGGGADETEPVGGGEGGAEELTGAEAARVYRELQSRHQIDLNDARNLQGLEDPGLVAHMEAARVRLAAQTQALARLPQREALRTEYLRNQGALTEALTGVEAEIAQLRAHLEEVFVVPRHCAEFAQGREPHRAKALTPAARADASVCAALQFLGERAAKAADGIEKAVAGLEEWRQVLFTARREGAAVFDGLLALLEGTGEERQLLRECLALAPRPPRLGPSGNPSAGTRKKPGAPETLAALTEEGPADEDSSGQ